MRGYVVIVNKRLPFQVNRDWCRDPPLPSLDLDVGGVLE